MSLQMNRTLLSRALLIGLSLGALAGCAGNSERPPELVRLESELSRLEADPAVASHAAKQLGEAREAVDTLASDGRRMKAELFDHNVHIASRLLRIAEADGRTGAVRAQLETMGSERERLVAQARRAEAERARAQAMTAQQRAEEAQLLAQQERLAAEASRREAEEARARLLELEQTLADLQAKQTERGLVVTLGDVLFEVDQAALKPGAARNLQPLVDALRTHPDTTLQIEGHTDSTGSAEYNIGLSQRRAEAVKTYLVSQGIEGSRLATRGLGKDYPVASNESAAGRQQNRRVEIVIQNLEGADQLSSRR
jgi:outer membrane protein OmpA-like peptidoglycan-associated protein